MTRGFTLASRNDKPFARKLSATSPSLPAPCASTNSTLCMSRRAAAGPVDGWRCLAKPIQGADLQAAMGNGGSLDEAECGPPFPEAWAVRARARYAAVGDLVEVALELARAAGSNGEG